MKLTASPHRPPAATPACPPARGAGTPCKAKGAGLESRLSPVSSVKTGERVLEVHPRLAGGGLFLPDLVLDLRGGGAAEVLAHRELVGVLLQDLGGVEDGDPQRVLGVLLHLLQGPVVRLERLQRLGGEQ